MYASVRHLVMLRHPSNHPCSQRSFELAVPLQEVSTQYRATGSNGRVVVLIHGRPRERSGIQLCLRRPFVGRESMVRSGLSIFASYKRDVLLASARV